MIVAKRGYPTSARLDRPVSTTITPALQAARMGVSMSTVKGYMVDIFRKAGVNNRTAAVVWWKDHQGTGSPRPSGRGHLAGAKSRVVGWAEVDSECCE